MTAIEDELGEIVRKDYSSVRYYPFNNQPGSPFILTSDPYSYLQSWLDSKIVSVKRDRTGKRHRFEKAKYFAEISEGFFISSRQSRMPVKGTLIYYSLLNLVKSFLLVKGLDLETKKEYHGLSLPSSSTTTLKLSTVGADGISIFHEFGKYLGITVDNSLGVDLEITDLLRQLPEVHEIGYALSLFGGGKRKFLPVDINIRTNKARKKIYYTISYLKKFDKIMRTDKLQGGIFQKQTEFY